MLVNEIAETASAVLDAAEDRMIGANSDGLAYDHAGAEARIVVMGCLDLLADEAASDEELGGALETLQSTAAALARLPVPTGRGVLWVQVRAELQRRGHPLPAPMRALS